MCQHRDKSKGFHWFLGRDGGGKVTNTTEATLCGTRFTEYFEKLVSDSRGERSSAHSPPSVQTPTDSRGPTHLEEKRGRKDTEPLGQ
ncbi:hypothetical protein CEXT_143361 [Caerostris extrusa]|uniref:Uncharacterized protein n=1 Tax=Caerostris extrusa TaxID=172846 RepID=A0AAV4P8H5_CAEEX|nr:hypothetical protein CEXT_143361 [Caerostris extrusa]